MNLLFDIGGTKTRIAISSNLTQIDSKIILPTETTYANFVKNLSENIKKVTDLQEFENCVIGVPGSLNKSTNMLFNAPHLKDWVGRNIVEDMKKIISASNFFVLNDTALVGLGESVFGSAKNYKSVSYLTFSTGVGGVKICEGKICDSFYGFEPGHQIVNCDSEIKYLEDLVSGSALTRQFGNLENVPLEKKLELETIIAIALNNTNVYWSSEAVILGGGLINSDFYNLENIVKKFTELNRIFKNIPPVFKGELIDVGGIWGGIAFLRTL